MRSGSAFGSPIDTPQSMIEKFTQYAAQAITSPLARALDMFVSGRPSPVDSPSHKPRSPTPASSPLASEEICEHVGTPALAGSLPEGSPDLRSTGGTRMGGYEFFRKYVLCIRSPQQTVVEISGDALARSTVPSTGPHHAGTLFLSDIACMWGYIYCQSPPCLFLSSSIAFNSDHLCIDSFKADLVVKRWPHLRVPC